MANDKSNADSNSNSKAFGGVVAIVALIAGIYAVIQPQQQSIRDIKERVDILYQAGAARAVCDKETNQKIERIDRRFDEFRTRMEWSSDIFNSYVQNQERMNSMLFQKIFPELKYPSRDYWPLGPARERSQ